MKCSLGYLWSLESRDQFIVPCVQAYAHSLIFSGESKWGDPSQDAGSTAEEERQV